MRHGWLRLVSWPAIIALLASAAIAVEKRPQIVAPSSAEEGAEPATDKTAPPGDDRLVAIGALSGAHLYTTYAYIGAVADAHRQGVYKAQRVRELMTEMIRLAEANSRHLSKVRDGNLVDRDKKVIDEFLDVYELLTEEAEALTDYSRTLSREDLERYQDARSAAWRKLRTILGIKRPAAEAEEEK